MKPDYHGDFASGLEVRLACRAQEMKGPTMGLARGYVQGNLVILPQEIASDFLRFAQLNSKPCPVIGISEPGDWRVPSLGDDLDLRSDLPRYRIWRNGELVDEPTDVRDYWREDLTAFVLGCSYSFEEALLEAGLPLRYVASGLNVPMFRTNIACKLAGKLSGPLVVSMRSFKPADAIRAIQITSRYPAVHGAPVHIGLPEAIGIRNIMQPDYGDAVEVASGELPVFWACGVTPQA
ncbi:MAG: putative hydro-lyase, partial [Rhodomicrobium sp.]